MPVWLNVWGKSAGKIGKISLLKENRGMLAHAPAGISYQLPVGAGAAGAGAASGAGAAGASAAGAAGAAGASAAGAAAGAASGATAAGAAAGAAASGVVAAAGAAAGAAVVAFASAGFAGSEPQPTTAIAPQRTRPRASFLIFFSLNKNDKFSRFRYKRLGVYTTAKFSENQVLLNSC